MKVTMIVPCRRDSQSVVRKNLTTVGGIPLVERAVQLAKPAWEVIIATDDERIRDAAEAWDAKVYWREPVSADQTLDMLAVEMHQHYKWEDDRVLVWVQATCPHTTAHEVHGLVDSLASHAVGEDEITVYSAEPFHGVIGTNHGVITHRTVNRQFCGGTHRFTGAAMAHRASLLLYRRSRWADCSLPVEFQSSMDIDEPADLWLAQWRQTWPRIASLVAGGNGVGYGHISRQHLLRGLLPHAEWQWVADEGCAALLGEPAKATIAGDDCDMLVIDTPGGALPEWFAIPQPTPFVVNFSDNARSATGNMVIADLALGSDLPMLAPQYDCCLPPRSGRGILVSFGGEDKPDYSCRAWKVLRDYFGGLLAGGISYYRILLGPAYNGKLEPNGHDIVTGVPIDRLMLDHAAVVTGRGRTCVEAHMLQRAVFSVPLNDYDAKHTHTYGRAYSTVENAIAAAIDFCSDPGKHIIIKPGHPSNERAVRRILASYTAWRDR